MSESALFNLLIAIVSGIAAAVIAWEMSAIQIGKECDRLGGFWVHQTVYECKKKEQP